MTEKSNEISALISLLDDSDKEVFEHVSEKLVSLGPEIIPTLENAWSENFDPTLNERIEELIHRIQFDVLVDDFRKWKAEEEFDLLDAVILISRYQYPELDEAQVREQVEAIRKEIWVELHSNLTPYEQINIVNQVLYSIQSFKGNVVHAQDPRYYCINQVLETKKGNSLSLGILYLILARQLDVPVFGVNLPKHFVLSFFKYPDPDFSDVEMLRKDVMFYINPLNKGYIFSRKEINEYLKKSRLDPKDEYFIPCSNLTIIEQLLKSIIEIYRNSGNPDKADELNQLLEIAKD